MFSITKDVVNTIAPALCDRSDAFVHHEGEENEGWMSKFFDRMHIHFNDFSEVLKVQEATKRKKHSY